MAEDIGTVFAVAYVIGSYFGTFLILRRSRFPDLYLLALSPVVFPIMVLHDLSDKKTVKRWFDADN